MFKCLVNNRENPDEIQSRLARQPTNFAMMRYMQSPGRETSGANIFFEIGAMKKCVNLVDLENISLSFFFAHDSDRLCRSRKQALQISKTTQKTAVSCVWKDRFQHSRNLRIPLPTALLSAFSCNNAAKTHLSGHLAV